jgi:hypothetical protein
VQGTVSAVAGNLSEEPENADGDNDGNTIAMSALPGVANRRAKKGDGGQ